MEWWEVDDDDVADVKAEAGRINERPARGRGTDHGAGGRGRAVGARQQGRGGGEAPLSGAIDKAERRSGGGGKVSEIGREGGRVGGERGECK